MKQYDYLVKFGGSLLNSIENYRKLLEVFSNNEEKTIFYIGSGPTGEFVKTILKKTGNGNKLNKKQEVLFCSSIRRITALITESMNDKFILCRTFDECEQSLLCHRKPIIDNEAFSRYLDGYNLKADYQAALLCKTFNINKLMIITDVPGVYSSNPRIDKNAKFISYMNTSLLAQLDSSCVDVGVEKVLKDYKIECVVYGMNEIILNGYVSYKYAKDNGTFIDWGE